jgi:hypothetical protein
MANPADIQDIDKQEALTIISELNEPGDTWAFRMGRLLFLEDEIRAETNVWRKVSSNLLKKTFFPIKDYNFLFISYKAHD